MESNTVDSLERSADNTYMFPVPKPVFVYRVGPVSYYRTLYPGEGPPTPFLLGKTNEFLLLGLFLSFPLPYLNDRFL